MLESRIEEPVCGPGGDEHLAGPCVLDKLEPMARWPTGPALLADGRISGIARRTVAGSRHGRRSRRWQAPRWLCAAPDSPAPAPRRGRPTLWWGHRFGLPPGRAICVACRVTPNPGELPRALDA